MKLLFENWRKYLKEEDEPDIVIEPGHGTPRPKREEDIFAGKVVDLFMASPAQAIHLGETMEIDPELLRPMKSALEAFSNLVKVYATPGSERSDDDLALAGYSAFERSIHEIMRHPASPGLRDEGYQSTRQAIKLVAAARALARQIPSRWRRSAGPSLNDKLYNSAIFWLGDRGQ